MLNINKNPKSLNLLPIGKKATISHINATGKDRRRLLDLGLVNGALIEAVHKSPSGDPIAYFIKGTTIALRKEDSQKIFINI